MTRLPFTVRERRRASYHLGYGKREFNNWNAGDLPSPYAEGDILELTEPAERIDDGPGFYIVAGVFSIGEGDEWYFRVTNDPKGGRMSDRLHVLPGTCDYMAPFRLVDTADPEGLALRERLLAEGWEPPAADEICPTCGQVTRRGVN